MKHRIYTAAKGGDPKYVRQMLTEFENRLQEWQLVGAIDIGMQHASKAT